MCLAGEPSVESAKRELGLADDEVDDAYGLVCVDPGRRLYAMRVTEDAGRRVCGHDPAASGPYSDPSIAPYGRTDRA